MEKQVSFYSEGFRLAGTLFIPNDLAQGERRGGIIICRGFGANARDNAPVINFTRCFCDQGYVVLSLDYRGFGESEGPRWRMIPMVEVEDVRNAVTFLQQQSEVNRDQIGVWGSSFGGAIAICAAGLDERIKCVVVNVPVGNGKKWLRSIRNNWDWQGLLDELEEDRVRRVLTGKSKMVDELHIMALDPLTRAQHDRLKRENPGTYVNELPLETAQAIIDFAPDEIVHKIAPRPVLFTVAGKDLLTPVELAKELYDHAGEPKKFVIIPGINHYESYIPPQSAWVMDEAVTWFRQYLPMGGL